MISLIGGEPLSRLVHVNPSQPCTSGQSAMRPAHWRAVFILDFGGAAGRAVRPCTLQQGFILLEESDISKLMATTGKNAGSDRAIVDQMASVSCRAALQTEPAEVRQQTGQAEISNGRCCRGSARRILEGSLVEVVEGHAPKRGDCVAAGAAPVPLKIGPRRG